mmetsp:Transcript_13039/g.19770  ORF Transcript_13039/g.19770 Transcript_13039/m.19770 type:complete len:88 (-) Transcript_13039:113-376(-)
MVPLTTGRHRAQNCASSVWAIARITQNNPPPQLRWTVFKCCKKDEAQITFERCQERRNDKIDGVKSMSSDEKSSNEKSSEGSTEQHT